MKLSIIQDLDRWGGTLRVFEAKERLGCFKIQALIQILSFSSRAIQKPIQKLIQKSFFWAHKDNLIKILHLNSLKLKKLEPFCANCLLSC